MKKEILICEFVEELLARMDESKDINCCKKELRAFCNQVVAKMGEDKIEVEWKS